MSLRWRESVPLSGDVVLHRLRARGFQLESEEEAAELGPWLRLTPMLQALLFGLSTVTGAAPAFWLLAALMVVGIVSGWHPFDLFYNGVIRPIEKTPELPATPLRRRLVFVLGIVWCLATARAFTGGNPALGWLLGGIMTASTALLAFTHICIPSQVMLWATERMRRTA